MCIDMYREGGGTDMTDGMVKRIAEKWVTVEVEERGGDSPFGWGADAHHICIGKYVSETSRDAKRVKKIAEFVREQVESAIREALQEYAASEWVDVRTGKFPTERTWVIVYTEHDGKRRVAPGYGVRLGNDSGLWRWESEFPVIAWRPLPQAPAGTGEEAERG